MLWHEKRLADPKAHRTSVPMELDRIDYDGNHGFESRQDHPGSVIILSLFKVLEENDTRTDKFKVVEPIPDDGWTNRPTSDV